MDDNVHGVYLEREDGLFRKERLRIIEYGFFIGPGFETKSTTGYVTRTVEGDIGLVFRPEYLRPATKKEIQSYKRVKPLLEVT